MEQAHNQQGILQVPSQVQYRLLKMLPAHTNQ